MLDWKRTFGALALFAAACAGEPAAPESVDELATRRALQFENGTGVRVAPGIALTNHHIVSNSWRAANTVLRPLAPTENFQSFSGQAGEHEALRKSHYCFQNDGRTVQLMIVAEPINGLCFPVANVAMLHGVAELLFTMESLDLAVLRLDGDDDEPPLTFGTAAVGSEVVIAGYPRGQFALTRCQVARPAALVKDPDPRILPELRWTIPSFTLSCPANVVTYGSSGSGVYDAKSGALLGVLWAGNENGSEVYVAPIDPVAQFF